MSQLESQGIGVRANATSQAPAMMIGALIMMALVGCQKAPTGEGLKMSAGLQSNRIVNGVEANGSEPFAAHVVGIGTKNTTNGYSVYCTGTLINEKTIVTAAHCVDGMSGDNYVVFGLKENASAVQGRKIIRSSTHERYNSWFPDSARDVYDIGIVQFAGDLPYGYRPAKILPDDSYLTDGAEILLAGYGVTDGSMQTNSGTLRYVSVRIAEGKYGQSEIRTDERAAGSCNGDSGGPGFIQINGMYYLWGATSRGDARCRKEGVYTKVTYYRDWLDGKIATWKSLGIEGIEQEVQPESEPNPYPIGTAQASGF